MLNIEKNANGSELEFKLSGRLDTTTAPELEAELKDSLEGADVLILDFSEIEYISSAGLRVLLSAQKTMNRQGSMCVKNVSQEVNEIFEVTGFSEILTIQ